jgi:hypothetical protein
LHFVYKVGHGSQTEHKERQRRPEKRREKYIKNTGASIVFAVICGYPKMECEFSILL